jgi:hypothetical protein
VVEVEGAHFFFIVGGYVVEVEEVWQAVESAEAV